MPVWNILFYLFFLLAILNLVKCETDEETYNKWRDQYKPAKRNGQKRNGARLFFNDRFDPNVEGHPTGRRIDLNRGKTKHFKV